MTSPATFIYGRLWPVLCKLGLHRWWHSYGEKPWDEDYYCRGCGRSR
jgi:hypothetical protein